MGAVPVSRDGVPPSGQQQVERHRDDQQVTTVQVGFREKPYTRRGMAAMTAADFGMSPARIRKPALTETTKRLNTPVKGTSPTFCAKVVLAS